MKYKYNVVRSPRFNRDLKKAAKLGLNTDEAEAVIRLLPKIAVKPLTLVRGI